MKKINIPRQLPRYISKDQMRRRMKAEVKSYLCFWEFWKKWEERRRKK